MKLSLIVALSRNGAIGKDGKLPWPKIPEDMENFRRLTMGHGIIMGRKTWQSLDGPLKGRRNVVMTRMPYFNPKGVSVAWTPMEAVAQAYRESNEAFVIGGAEIYRLLGPLCDEAHVTMIDRHIDGDTLFPDYGMCDGWQVADKRQLAPDVYYSHRIKKPCLKPTTPGTSP